MISDQSLLLSTTYHIDYSVGVIYLVIQNLPRNLRYRKENIILIGLIPGPREPKLSINSFLHPLVAELKELWSGVQFECPHNPLRRVTIRAALTCCSCDIPATRKLCGFVGHSAKRGCSKCSKLFPSLRHNENKRDYSGFDRDEWPTRDLIQHKQQAYNHLNADTRQEQKNIESNYGIRYSVLLELPYWNPIEHSIVDPMYNLFLGTGKHVMKVWVERGIITKRDFSKQNKLLQRYLLHAVLVEFQTRSALDFLDSLQISGKIGLQYFPHKPLKRFYPQITFVAGYYMLELVF